MTAFLDEGTAHAMQEAGAHAILSKDSYGDELGQAIKMAFKGQGYLGRGVAEMLSRDPCHPKLTDREVQVLTLIAKGVPDEDAARRLGIDKKTLSWHRRNVMEKTGIMTDAGLTKLAIRWGLTTLDA